MIKVSHTGKTAKGRVVLPASKSLANRALIIQALGKGIVLHNVSTANDTRVLQNVLEGKPCVADIGDAGTAMRFLLAYFARCEGSQILTGSARMQQRPIGPLVDALRSMGASINYTGTEGYPPVEIKGKSTLKNAVSIRGDISSQYISALMLIGPAIGGLTITLEGELTSAPYIAMTAALMQQFGADVTVYADKVIIGATPYAAGEYTVEPDWSAASYFFEIAALVDEAEILLEGLSLQSLQGDKEISSLYQNQFGITYKATAEGLVIIKNTGQATNQYLPETNFTAMPDMAQTYAATTVGIGAKASLTGLHTLRIKETDRIAALKNELSKAGAIVEAGPDYLNIININKPTQAPKFNTYNDHRMAMALAPLAMVFGSVWINDETVVSKSFPQYWQQLESLGFIIEHSA